MSNETFGVTMQAAICQHFDLEFDFSSSRLDSIILSEILNKNIIDDIFKSISVNPIKFLTTSQEYTDHWITKCPHNFLLSNNETFSIRTFNSNNRKFAPKIVGQPGNKTINHFFGHLVNYNIDRTNFKKFCFENVQDIIPILLDYTLVSDYNCYFFFDDDKTYNYIIYKRGDLPELVFSNNDFTFTKSSAYLWKESNTIKYKNITAGEFQLHNNRAGFKLRLSVDFLELVSRERIIDITEDSNVVNNSTLGDSAELAICEMYNLSDGLNDDKLVSNSNLEYVSLFRDHYTYVSDELFPYEPIKYSGNEKRNRGGVSKSGVDFILSNNLSLSVKTNKDKSRKVCPPEIGQPSPSTFDLYFENTGLYDGKINADKFRLIVMNPDKVSVLLHQYVAYLNECDYLLWSVYHSDNKKLVSRNIAKSELCDLNFRPEHITYTNNFRDFDSVTIKYMGKSLGEFQIHSARNSLKFRFHMEALLNLMD